MMIRVFIVLLLALTAVCSGAGNDSARVSSSPTTNQNITDIFGNVLGLLGNLFQNSNNKTVDETTNLMKTLFGGALDGNNGGTSSKSGDNDTGNALDLLQLLKPVLPFLTGGRAPTPSELFAMASNYLGSGDFLKNAGVSSNCRNDVYQWFNGLKSFEGWAWKMIDAGFKIPSNVAGINLKWLGNREECLAIQSNGSYDVTGNNEAFHGKYCRLYMPLADLFGRGPQALLLGACASHRCSNEDVTSIVKTVISAVTSGRYEQTVYTACTEEIELDSGAKAAIAILSILGVLVICGTLYDVIVVQLETHDGEPTMVSNLPPSYYDISKVEHNVDGQYNGGYEKNEHGVELQDTTVNDDDQSKTVKATSNPTPPSTKPVRGVLANALLAFSVYTNGCKLLGTNQGSGSLGAINGIRFLSMGWVILGHTYYFAGNYLDGYGFVGKKFNQWTFSAVLYASVSVDSFFALSGTLVAYLTLRELKKAGGAAKFNWFMFYFHRFWRLTPPYMLVIMVGTTLYKYIGSGAMKMPVDQGSMAPCRDNWWTNLLYVNNYVRTDEMCMGWSWYLANDMQLYVVSPILLVPLFYNVICGGILSALLIGGAVVTSAVMANSNGYLAQSIPAAGQQAEHYFRDFYIPVWTRFGPYVVGLLTGYILYRTKCKCKIPKIINIICWFLCIGSTCAFLYGPYSDGDSHIFTQTEHVVYLGFLRTGWGVLICWMIFACATGNGGWINTVLSWSPFVPLGRLTYLAYLLHPLVMLLYYETRDNPIVLTEYGTVYLFLGNLVLSYGAAFIASLFFESPMMGLEKAIFKKK